MAAFFADVIITVAGGVSAGTAAVVGTVLVAGIVALVTTVAVDGTVALVAAVVVVGMVVVAAVLPVRQNLTWSADACRNAVCAQQKFFLSAIQLEAPSPDVVNVLKVLHWNAGVVVGDLVVGAVVVAGMVVAVVMVAALGVVARSGAVVPAQ